MHPAIASLSVADLAKLIDAHRTPALVDVRTPAEYRAQHIAGSHLMPLDELDCAAIASRFASADRCVLVCKGGIRASRAAASLAEFGMPGVTVLDGGIAAWTKAGLPVIRGKNSIPMEVQIRTATGMLAVIGVMLGKWLSPGLYALSAIAGSGLILAGTIDAFRLNQGLAKAAWSKDTECKV